jgi:hypothetical protein
MDLAAILISQYQASLEMLKQTIAQCPEPVWNAASDKNKFWHIAYHALFFAHLFVEASEEDFTPWIQHRDEYHDMQVPPVGEPYDREALLEYLAFCQQHIAERVPRLNLEAATGYESKPFSMLELQIHSIRHLMQHTGELMERLGTRTGAEIDWVGSKPG